MEPTEVRRPRRAGLAAYAGTVALSAYAGAFGLATGALDLGPRLNARLPFQSPVLGGVALASVVGIPTTIVAVNAWKGAPSVNRAAVVAGTLLVGWIATELAFIREPSWLQVVYAGVGASFIVVGVRDR